MHWSEKSGVLYIAEVDKLLSAFWRVMAYKLTPGNLTFLEKFNQSVFLVIAVERDLFLLFHNDYLFSVLSVHATHTSQLCGCGVLLSGPLLFGFHFCGVVIFTDV